MLAALALAAVSVVAADSSQAGQVPQGQIVRPDPPQPPRPIPPASLWRRKDPYVGLFQGPPAAQAGQPAEPRVAGRVVAGPTIVCGMPMFHANPDIDPKIGVKKQGDLADYKIRAIPAPCR